MIPESILRNYGARLVELAKGEILFDEGELAQHFYLVQSGRIKMSSYNDQGREFVKGYFTEGQSFGEPPFFNHMPYPASAIATADSTVWRCPHDSFIRLLAENFEIHLKLTQVLCGRLMYKSMMMTEIAVEEADHRLTTLIEYFRKSSVDAAGHEYRVPYTRQQLADMTGLRVETVIRTIKAMEAEGRLRIEEGKIVWRSPNRSDLHEEE
jgi:CRP/FNR family transcriptional regulator, cyclic AMP receptor protein